MSRAERTASPIVKLLVIAHVFAITVYALPKPPQAMLNGVVAWRWPASAEEFPAFASELPDWLLYAIFTNWRAPMLNERPPFKDTWLEATPIVIEGPIQYYALRFGTWQSWDMFAPNPSDTDLWGDAIIVYRDGTRVTGGYPRIYDLPIPVKYQKERFRKFYERAHLEDNAYLWPVFAQRIAYEQATEPANPPTEVRLRRHFQKFRGPDRPMPTDYETVEYYVHQVDQAALKRTKGWR